MKTLPTAISALAGLEGMRPDSKVEVPLRGPNITLEVIKQKKIPTN